MTERLILSTGEVHREAIFHADGTFTVSATQDVEAILERNKELQNHSDGYTPSRDLRYVAEIPLVVAEEWMKKYGVDVLDPNHKAAVRRLLNSNEYRYLRTAAGQLRR